MPFLFVDVGTPEAMHCHASLVDFYHPAHPVLKHVTVENLSLDGWRATYGDPLFEPARVYILYELGGYLSREALEWLVHRYDVQLFVPGTIDELDPYLRETAEKIKQRTVEEIRYADPRYTT